jgi:peptidoglycan hydrolase CwlO-like protein
VGLKKLEDLKTPLEEQKKQIEAELEKLEALKKRKATTGGALAEQPAVTERYFGLALTDLLAKEKSKVPRLLQVGFAFLEKNCECWLFEIH